MIKLKVPKIKPRIRKYSVVSTMYTCILKNSFVKHINIHNAQ